MQQLWAQVKETMYVPGQKNWFLSPDERELLHDSNEAYRTQSSVEDLILEHVNFGSEYAKPVQMTKLLRDLGIKAPRMPDFKEASRVLHERGIEPRRSNGKKIYDLEYTPVEEDSGGFSSNYGSDWAVHGTLIWVAWRRRPINERVQLLANIYGYVLGVAKKECELVVCGV